MAISLTMTALTYVITYYTYTDFKNFWFRENVYIVFDVHNDKYLCSDTISEVSLNYPRKIFNPDKDLGRFSIATSNTGGLFLGTKPRKQINASKISSLNIVSLDYFIKIIRIKEMKSDRKFDHVSLNIIELHSDRAFRMKAAGGSYTQSFIEPELKVSDE